MPFLLNALAGLRALALPFFFKKKSKDILSAPQSYKVGNLGSQHCLVMFQGTNLRSNQIIIGSLLQALISKLKVSCRDAITCDPCVYLHPPTMRNYANCHGPCLRDTQLVHQTLTPHAIALHHRLSQAIISSRERKHCRWPLCL